LTTTQRGAHLLIYQGLVDQSYLPFNVSLWTEVQVTASHATQSCTTGAGPP